MEVTNVRPTNEAAQIAAASLQSSRFQERRLREAHSDVRNQAVYFSPVIRIDQKTSTAIMQYRDSETGKVEREYPAPPKEGAYIQAEVASNAKPEVKKARVDDAPAQEKQVQNDSPDHIDQEV